MTRSLCRGVPPSRDETGSRCFVYNHNFPAGRRNVWQSARIPLRMTLAAEIAVLARVHWRSFRAKARQTARHSRLLTGTIVLFLAGYLVVGFWMFSRGLEYM